MAVLPMMAHNTNHNTNHNIVEDVKPTIFHDFLSKDASSSSDLLPPALLADVRPPAEAPISSTSDLASERQAGNHFEGVPFYGLRSEFSAPEIASRFTGNKRANSDSGFLGSSRDGLQQMRPEYLESSHVMKMLRGTSGGPRRPQDEEAVLGMHPVRPTSTSLILQSSASGRADVNTSKWERATPISVGPVLQYPPRMGQVVPFGYQALPNRFKDANVGAGPSIMSQAADEGSRTGIKGSKILNSINVDGGFSDRNVTAAGNQKLGNRISEIESSNLQNRQGVTSASRQMTIFYGGQAHVFDAVHPNKADVIMALAGSNGGSWSTNFSPKSAVRPPRENDLPSSENNMAISPAFPREFRGRLSVAGSSSHGIGSTDQTSIPTGFREGSLLVKEVGGLNREAERTSEKKKYEL